MAWLSCNKIDCWGPKPSGKFLKFPQQLAVSEMGSKWVNDREMTDGVELTRSSMEPIVMAHRISRARRVLLPA
ncbi:MAG: hypothetical protein DWI00_01220 [Planctomycetota bacterium]|nr:MAG: hypothetical protein DWI00_01220 [Planctomycetota bacterium]